MQDPPRLEGRGVPPKTLACRAGRLAAPANTRADEQQRATTLVETREHPCQPLGDDWRRAAESTGRVTGTCVASAKLTARGSLGTPAGPPLGLQPPRPPRLSYQRRAFFAARQACRAVRFPHIVRSTATVVDFALPLRASCFRLTQRDVEACRRVERMHMVPAASCGRPRLGRARRPRIGKPRHHGPVREQAGRLSAAPSAYGQGWLRAPSGLRYPARGWHAARTPVRWQPSLNASAVGERVLVIAVFKARRVVGRHVHRRPGIAQRRRRPECAGQRTGARSAKILRPARCSRGTATEQAGGAACTNPADRLTLSALLVRSGQTGSTARYHRTWLP